MLSDASVQRVQAALEGRLASAMLSEEESVVFDTEVQVRILRRMAEANFVEERRARGQRSVSMNDAGQILEHRADGTVVVLLNGSLS